MNPKFVAILLSLEVSAALAMDVQGGIVELVPPRMPTPWARAVVFSLFALWLTSVLCFIWRGFSSGGEARGGRTVWFGALSLLAFGCWLVALRFA